MWSQSDQERWRAGAGDLGDRWSVVGMGVDGVVDGGGMRLWESAAVRAGGEGEEVGGEGRMEQFGLGVRVDGLRRWRVRVGIENEFGRCRRGRLDCCGAVGLGCWLG